MYILYIYYILYIIYYILYIYIYIYYILYIMYILYIYIYKNKNKTVCIFKFIHICCIVYNVYICINK